MLAAERIESAADVRLWRVRYRTLDASGRPVAASMAVGAPANGRDADRPVVAWVHGAVGVAPGCGPSRAGLVMPYAASLLAAGAVVVAPDLTGLGVEGVRHPYLHGTTAGRSVLDAVRAAAAFEEAGARPVAALAGHSAGGHAVMWANQLATEDVDDGLDVRAVAAIAPIGDLVVAMDHYATTVGHAAFAVQLAATWPGIEPVDAGDVLTTAAQHECTVLDRACLDGVLGVYRGDPSPWIRPAGFHTGAWPHALAAQSVGGAPGRARVVIVHGADDGSVLPAWSEQLVADIRLAGGDAELRRHRHADHNGVLEAARHEVVELLVAAIGLSRR